MDKTFTVTQQIELSNSLNSHEWEFWEGMSIKILCETTANYFSGCIVREFLQHEFYYLWT